MFDFSIVTSWIHGLLTSLMPVGLAVFLECVIVGVCLLLMYAVIAILMIFMERKVCAAFQCRLGPVRVGPWGTLQVICDVFKMLTNPTEVLGDERGWVTGIRCVEMELGEPDASGRRRPIVKEGSEFELDVDTMIMALGTSPNPLIRSTTPGLETNNCLLYTSPSPRD